MAPSKKSKSATKRFSYTNEVDSKKDGENDKRSGQRKRKLSAMLGPQWRKEELEQFYEAYRKYGKDWKKVAATVRNRSVEMVEGLYTMNRAYLSLPEGTASVVGLIAMMTDHYSALGGSDSEEESNEGIGASRKPQKRGRGNFHDLPSKGLDGPIHDPLQFQSAASNSDCLSLLRKRHSGSMPRAVGRRTPRVPVSYSYDKVEGKRYFSPIKQELKQNVDAVDDDVAHEVALALTEASQRGGSPEVSYKPNKKAETDSPVRDVERMHAESEMTTAKLPANYVDEDHSELSLGSTEADNGDAVKINSIDIDIEGGSTVEVHQKRKIYHGRKPEAEESVTDCLEETKKVCSGTQRQKLNDIGGKLKAKLVDARVSRVSAKDARRRNKKGFSGKDEVTSFDALQTLADLSLMMPNTTSDSESSVRFKKEKAEVAVAAFRTSKKGKRYANDVIAIPESKEDSHQTNVERQKRRQKSLSHDATDKLKKMVNKGKRSTGAAKPKKGKLLGHPERTPSSVDNNKELNDTAPLNIKVPSTNQVNLPTKVRSKRKINTPKRVMKTDFEYSEDIVNGKLNVPSPSIHCREPDVKEMVSNFLSWYQARRWCSFEWFYGAIDYPWFAKREFVEYLDYVGLGHIPRLTRDEWGVIRSSLGKPRRFSEQFLKEEREKLNQYRESVRNHYAELRSGIRQGLPTDLAQPLSVGQQVIAVHPKTGEIHDGRVVTVDHSGYRIQFDKPELGLEFVMDIHCMPSNPLENWPASLARQNVSFNNKELKMNGQPEENKIEENIKLPCQNLENRCSTPHRCPSEKHINNLSPHVKVDASSPNLRLNVGPNGTVLSPQAVNFQPSVLSQLQGREADVQALSELTRALEKKEAVVYELQQMNDELLEDQKSGDNSLKGSDSFKKQYAAVLLQLNEVNEQVSSALLCLRQRNTYQMYPKSLANIGEHECLSSSLDHSAYYSQESISHVVDIVASSRTKARSMVDAAMQTISSMKKGGKNIERIEEAIDFINNQLSVDDSSDPAARSSVASLDHLIPNASSPLVTSHMGNAKSDGLSDQDEGRIPSELIAHCVAALLMIQKCTERQFPPSDVAQVLDSAVTSVQPCCSQNLPIYIEIQKYMGIIRNQILALVPT